VATYSEDQKAAALTTLAAKGANVSGTAKALGIPESTLRLWSKGKINAQVAEKCEVKKSDLAADMRSILQLLIGDMHSGVKRADASLKDTATAVGIVTDKIIALEADSKTPHNDGNAGYGNVLPKLAEFAHGSQ
jgi:hypothetical protein